MNLSLLDRFQDDYLRRPEGQGVFLAGVVLGYLAGCQVESEQKIKDAPLFKQIQFGRLDMKSLKRLLARVPQLLAAYSEAVAAPHLVAALSAEAGRLMLVGGAEELGVDGNFAFTVGFGNARTYFWQIFKKESKEEEE
ncbi:MAG TPA: CRISPR-associated protein [Firmicutes bacterium]|nr:CRISPR-associated protein [Bacillota bacterium]